MAALVVAVIVTIWSELDQMTRRGLRIEEAVLGFACCGIPGGVTGAGLAALGTVILKARRR
jgi:hypothetical protein